MTNHEKWHKALGICSILLGLVSLIAIIGGFVELGSTTPGIPPPPGSSPSPGLRSRRSSWQGLLALVSMQVRCAGPGLHDGLGVVGRDRLYGGMRTGGMNASPQ